MLKIAQFDAVTRIDSARTIAGRGYYWSTAYLVDGLLIDTGCAYSAGQMLQALDGFHLNTVFNTHSHEDHIGANGALQRQRDNLPIYVHPLAIPVLSEPRKNQPLELYRRVLWGWPQPSSGSPVADNQLIETENFKFRVIYTPGHSPDHCCLYEQDRGWLFSGDLFVGGKDRALAAGYDIWRIIAALKMIQKLPLSWLFPGCARVRENPAQELADKIAYLEETGANVLKLHGQGFSVKEISSRLFGGPMLIEWITAGNFSRRRLVEAYLKPN